MCFYSCWSDIGRNLARFRCNVSITAYPNFPVHSSRKHVIFCFRFIYKTLSQNWPQIMNEFFIANRKHFLVIFLDLCNGSYDHVYTTVLWAWGLYDWLLGSFINHVDCFLGYFPPFLSSVDNFIIKGLCIDVDMHLAAPPLDMTTLFMNDPICIIIPFVLLGEDDTHGGFITDV